ncbi:MAG: glycosyl hydrolase [Flavobacteriaceae bacterium]|nr:glycosyl hydrolase [Flavobacteriaceae bacterium]
MKLVQSLSLVFAFISFSVFSQQPSSQSKAVLEALKQKENLINNSLVKNIAFESIGPTIMSGRVVDLDVNPEDPTEFYVAYASGGLWYTDNNGTSFKPVLDNAPTQNIGDIAVDWKNNTIWVGTGENNSSRSSYAGIGILKSIDSGETWNNVGLNDSHHIGRILIHPDNPDEVVIAVVGHLYSPNEERGIFKTTDGGQTWEKTLFINKDTGIIDLIASPQDFNVLYAASWERERKAWNFNGSGENSGIYKSIDGGNNWNKITNDNGFPSGEGVGRIGLAANSNNEVYAILDNQYRRKKEPVKESVVLAKDDFKDMSAEKFLSLKDEELNTFLKNNGFEDKYSADNLKAMVKDGSIKPYDITITSYLGDANRLLFDTPVIGAELYKSLNGGASWEKTHDDYLDGLVNSYGYYFGVIKTNPKHPEKVYIAGVPILRSDDKGKTFESINRENVHADHHAIWINPKNDKHLIIGNDGGVNISYDDGENWIKCNTPTVGQFYSVNVDNQKPYNVYGGLQDNGVWMGPNNYEPSVSWHEEGEYPYKRLLGGDGMHVEIDDRNPNIIYTGYQFGYYYRINSATGKRVSIQPKFDIGEDPYRFNWQTPIELSTHNQDILYLGAHRLMRSMNKGDDWQIISEDLTKGSKVGNVPYGTLTTISESPFQFGLIYTGSDDGLVHVTKNSGGSWTKISDSFPKDLWVSRVIASQHKRDRVYVTLNGYRWDDFTTYVFMSDDYGTTWKSIRSNIPNSPVNVIKEDPENENLLYLGTDNGAYVSLNQGESWEVFIKGLTAVAVHDLVIQQEAKDLVLGTHGRSFYKANIGPLQNLNKTILNKKIHLFEIAIIKHRKSWGSSWNKWLKPNTPKIKIPFYVKNAGNYKVKILSDDNALLHSYSLEADRGFNEAIYDLAINEKNKNKLQKSKGILIEKAKNDKYYLPKDLYFVQIGSEKTELKIE